MLLLGCGCLLTATAQTLPGWKLVWRMSSPKLTAARPIPANGVTRSAEVVGATTNSVLHLPHQQRPHRARPTGHRSATGKFQREELHLRPAATKGKWSWTTAWPKRASRFPAVRHLGRVLDAGRQYRFRPLAHLWRDRHHGKHRRDEHRARNHLRSLATRMTAIGGPCKLPGTAFADDFHVYAVEWETNRIRWFMDGQPYFTATPPVFPTAPPGFPSAAIPDREPGGRWQPAASPTVQLRFHNGCWWTMCAFTPQHPPSTNSARVAGRKIARAAHQPSRGSHRFTLVWHCTNRLLLAIHGLLCHLTGHAKRRDSDEESVG